MTRRAGCLIPACRVIRCQGKLEKPSQRHIGKAKDLKLNFEGRSSVQISILFYFPVKLDPKYISSGRILISIGFIEGLSRHNGCTSEAEKMTKIEFLKKLIFSNFENSKILEN